MVQFVVGKQVDANRLASLRAAFPGAVFEPFDDHPEAMREADAFLGRIPAEAFLLADERLRWIHSMGAGIETIIAIPGVVESEIVITNTRGAHAPFVAEHAFAMLLSLVRALPAFAQEQRDHVFAQEQRDHVFHQFGRHIPTGTLYGKRMLIVGMGNIGMAIARRALAFEMTVVGLVRGDPGHLGEEMSLLPIDEHLDNELRSADVLVIAVPYTTETDNLVDARRIVLLPDGAIVIGISRGRIIDEDALAARLRDGTLAGAGLDVFAQEPLPPDHHLWDTPNLIITPHAAPNSPLTKDREFEITLENVRRFIEGEPLLNICDKVAGF